MVLVGEFLAGGDVADGVDEDAFVFGFFRLAVGIAVVVEEHGGAKAVDHGVAVANAEEIGDGTFAVTVVGLGLGKTGAVVFEDTRTFADGIEGVAAGTVDGGGPNEEARGHVLVISFFVLRFLTVLIRVLEVWSRDSREAGCVGRRCAV